MKRLIEKKFVVYSKCCKQFVADPFGTRKQAIKAAEQVIEGEDHDPKDLVEARKSHKEEQT